MIRKIILTDFMAHARTEIELGPGLTVLTGPNNSGKSAVVEALRCLAVNPTPKFFIRHGAKEARAEVEFDDGTRLAWVRRDRYALYELTRPGADEPEVYAKFGRTPPRELSDLLGLSPIELEDAKEAREIDVHLGNQREPVFLINQPKTVMASFFASTTESAHLIKMQALLKHKILKAKGEEREYLTRLAGIEAGLDRLAPLPGAALAMERVRDGLDKAGRSRRGSAALDEFMGVLQVAKAGLARQQRLCRTLADLSAPPRPADVVRLASLCRDIDAKTKALRRAQALGRALSTLSPPTEAFDTAALARRVSALSVAALRRGQAVSQSSLLSRLATPPELFDTRGLAGVVGRLGGLRRGKEGSTGLLAVLETARPAPAPVPVAGLASLVAQLRELDRRASQARLSAADMTAKAEAASSAMAARLREIGACPLCGAALDPDHFFSHAGGEGA